MRLEKILGLRNETRRRSLLDEEQMVLVEAARGRTVEVAGPAMIAQQQNPGLGPLSSNCLRWATPRTEAEPIPRREMAAGLYNWSQSEDRYASTLAALRATCPVDIPEDRWRQAIADAELFISEWGGQAQGFGWTARELFGLATPLERPAATYSRLSRYDETGLIWLLRGRPVIALTETTAAIQSATAVLTYRKLNKPALGPLGDSLDDMGAAT
jgi:hypothetical protein